MGRMPVYALGDLVPRIDPTAFVHPEAVVIGDVWIGADSSIWPGAVLRGDGGGHIRIGARTSIQDNAVIHCTPECPTVVGSDCVVGHIAHLEGCTIEDNALVGSGSVVLHDAIVRSWSVVAANAVVRNRMEVPSGAIAVGVPATIKPDRADADSIRDGVQEYLAKSAAYKAGLRAVERNT
jgi:carbonic anhydrase/acetyltransferase-like protein (isoleucine patch superfamily)